MCTVSVIIPTYKRKDLYLKRAIDSVLNQTHKNIEVVVVDDNASEDLQDYRSRSNDLINKYNDSRITYIQNKKNLGGSLARNEGIKIASGNYITFLDDDDEYLSDKVKNQLSFMLKNDFDMTFTNLKLCNDEGNIVDFREYKDIMEYNGESLLEYHLTRHITGTPTFMYKKEILLNIGGFPDAKMGQEFYLMINTIKSGIKIGYLPTTDVIAYRHKDGGISMGKNKITGEMALYDFKKQYFDKISFRSRLFIRFRHHVVMAIAYKRNNQYLKMIGQSLIAGVTSPGDLFIEAYKFIKRISHNKKTVIDGTAEGEIKA